MNQLTIDELEMLNPYELGKLLHAEARKDFPDFQHIQDLLTVGCSIDARDDLGRTMLHYAAYEGDIEMVKFLISNGADIHARNNNGWTPLHSATQWGHLEMVKFLISKGADIHAVDNYDRTALHLGTINRELYVCKLLVLMGAQVNARTKGGYTAWDYASAYLMEECPELKP